VKRTDLAFLTHLSKIALGPVLVTVGRAAPALSNLIRYRNLRSGTYPQKTRQNYKKAAILRSSNSEIRKKISDSNIGKKDSEKTKAKKSQAAKLREAAKKLSTIKEIKQ
jgi:hypothetical protein